MSKKIEFVEIDVSGEKTLDAVAEADKFNDWMFNTIRPFCSGEILEIGSGIGNISQFFLDNDYQICLSDIRSNYCNKLSNKFSSYPNLLGVLLLDLVDPDFDEKYQKFLNKFDTVFALNVIEHIDDDRLAVTNCRKLLKKGGKLIVLVPSYQALFNQFDVELGHYRRYNLKTMTKVFKESKIEVLSKQYFNFMGILGWFFSGRILRKKTIPKGQMKFYNLLVPIFKIIDKIVFNKIGLSTIVIGEKKDHI